MASIGGLGLSALTARNENSLANLNFDFSLVKLEAPIEFQGLGNSLSIWRRTTAETGAAQRTARKLGQLFEQTVTIPDSLYAAYGLRVSEISTSESINPQNRQRYGLFEGHVGADATTIWAAATAGKSAMAVNLLACMLARLWSGPKAISIWYELVQHRKKRIHAECDGSEAAHIPQLVAAQQEITRNELAEWDSSSRAWISMADKVKESEHQDVETVLQSLSIPVDTSIDVYTSVIRVWNLAMSTMDSLIRGMPHSVNGAVLIAISAWHIYPDIDVFGDHNKSFTFNDQLVQRGGCLTVGIEDRWPETTSGVYWSLSLARLRYYGAPVALTAASADESKVSFEEFALVIFGSLLRSWACQYFNPNFEISEAAQLVVSIWEMLERAASASRNCREFMLLKDNWMQTLISAARTLAEPEEKGWRRAKRLALMGARNRARFLPTGQEYPSFFGLLDPSTILSILRDSEHTMITFLRDLTKSRQLHGERTIISYRNRETGLLEYATAVPCKRNSTKRSNDGKHSTSSGHIRWIQPLEKGDANCDCESEFEYEGDCEVEQSDEEVEQSDEIFDPNPVSDLHTAKPMARKPKKIVRGRKKAAKHHDDEETCPVSVKSKKEQQHIERRRDIESRGELCLEYNHMDIRLEDHMISWFNPPSCIDGGGPVAHSSSTSDGDLHHTPPPGVTEQPPSSFEFDSPEVDLIWEDQILELDRWTDDRSREFYCVVGRVGEAALLVRRETSNHENHTPDVTHLSLHEVQSVANTGALDGSKVLDHLHRLLSKREPEKKRNEANVSDFLMAFKILGSASQIYKLLPGAKVALRLLERDLSKINWAPKLSSLTDHTLSGIFSSFKLNRSQALACLASFETGYTSIEESELHNVFAISVGNSIYAPSALFNDPYELCEDFEIMRIVGNVGKPGLTMMIPPSHPQVIESEHDRWHVVNHEPFDATCHDYFDKTSLHLSFTGYEHAVGSTVEHGAVDIAAQYLETLVSVYDGKRWIADLDILSALGNARVKRLRVPESCAHDGSTLQRLRWISIDCWDELLDMTDETNIVRAHGNSLARLAAVTVATQVTTRRSVVLPPFTKCYECVKVAADGDNEASEGVQVSQGTKAPFDRKIEAGTIFIC